MGKMSNLSIGIIVAFTLVILFTQALNSMTPDTIVFNTYSEANDLSSLGEENLNYQNYTSNNSVTNFQLIANTLEQEIADAQQQLQSEGIAEQITIAFGLISTITIGVLKLFLAVIFESINFLAGISTNITDNFPPEWLILSQIAKMGMVIVLVYLSFKLVSGLLKWEI